MGDSQLLTFDEIRKVPGEYRNANPGWKNRRFVVNEVGNVHMDNRYEPGTWIPLSPHRLAWGTPDREFYPVSAQEIIPGRVYEDRAGGLCCKVDNGAWLYDICSGDLDTGVSKGTVVASHDPSEPCYGGLTLRPDLDIGFFRRKDS